MSKISFFDAKPLTFRPSEGSSGSASWLLVVAFLVLIGVLVFVIHSVKSILKESPAPTPPPNPGPSAADLQRLTSEIAKLNQPKPQP